MSFELHNKNEYDFECKDMAHILYLEYHFCYVGRYGGDFVEKYGSRYLDIQVTSMHNVHNDTHLLVN
jgi:hypothetical protein